MRRVIGCFVIKLPRLSRQFIAEKHLVKPIIQITDAVSIIIGKNGPFLRKKAEFVLESFVPSVRYFSSLIACIDEFVLVDFGSADGLQDWIYENFIGDIRSGYLKYYYTEEMEDWHASIAKNTTHLLASNEIITNLDCDNYSGVNGGKFVIDKGYQDVDLIIRLLSSGLRYIHIDDNLYNKTIPNTKEEGLLNVKTKSNWIDMNYRNSQRSRKNIRLGKFIANQDKNHIGRL